MMLGKLLSTAIKVATLPVDIAVATLDVVTGGDGSGKELERGDVPLPSKLRDAICDKIEDID